MLRILGRKSSSNVQKVLWCCAEMGVPFTQENIGAEFGKNDKPEYLALNPNGRVPTIDDEGFILWESNAIVRYLSAKHGLGSLCPTDPRKRADADRWMDWQQTTLSNDMRTLARTLLKAPPDATPAKELESAKQGSTRAWTVLNSHLAKQPYLAGDTLTMADIVFGNAVHRWHRFPIERPPLPHVTELYQRYSERPAYRAAVLAFAE